MLKSIVFRGEKRSVKVVDITQIQRKRRNLRLYKMRMRFSHVREDLGTFGKRYLSIVEGRVWGAILMEGGATPNYSRFRRQVSKSNLFVNVVSLKPFCPECGAKRMKARANEFYTIPIEIVCPSCGVVAEPEP